MAKQTHPLAGGIGILAALALLFSASAGAELRSLGDSDLDDVVGQAEISISASLNLQENPSQTRCAGGCGARLAIQPAGSGNNYLVIDDISGKFSFDEVTLDVVTIKDGFGGDGAAFNSPGAARRPEGHQLPGPALHHRWRQQGARYRSRAGADQPGQRTHRRHPQAAGQRQYLHRRPALRANRRMAGQSRSAEVEEPLSLPRLNAGAKPSPRIA